MELAAISRKKQFSPNNTGNDNEIFRLTIEKLKFKGFSIKEFTEEEFVSNESVHQYYFGMYRDKQSVEKTLRNRKEDNTELGRVKDK